MKRPEGLRAELARGSPAHAAGNIGMDAGIAMFSLVSGFFVRPLQEKFGWVLGGPVLGLLLLTTGVANLIIALVAITLIGLAQGAERDILAFFTARYFGLKKFRRGVRRAWPRIRRSVAIGGVGAGCMSDHFGSYGPTRITGAALSGVAALCILASGLRGQHAAVAEAAS
jgi:hypothetical protein